MGETFSKRRDAIEEIQSKLALMEKTGQIEEHNEIIKEKVSEKIKSPKALKLERKHKYIMRSDKKTAMV